MCSDGYLSTNISQTIGVPQGDKLSPLLFALFLADLSAELESTGCFTKFYADDLAIGSTELDNVKNAMFVLEKFCQRNSLKVNVGKTKVVKHNMAEGWPGPTNYFSTKQKSNSRIRLNT